ncbi:hypothetical protein, conserved [Eimeria maxima]|uniref:Uncharacterized protein n=1 Tax=Eimeria maxima TaxID=5804 RepID=U6MA77_EIMMA|nr:hypothetical protein, conserved [Eimeria maxima]CDJ59404.1 hypothetical protein, conserved [Eimeria maxima]
MCRGDDRDTLLFGSVSSQTSSEPNAATKDVAPLATYAQPFPVNQPQACLTLQCSSSAAIDRAVESVAPLQQSNLQQRTTRRHRHISLFASIELARPAVPPPANERSPSSSARERFQKLTVSPGIEPLNLQTPGSAIANRMGASLIARAASNSACTHYQDPRTDAISTFPKEQGEQSSAVAGANGEEAATPQDCDCALPNQLCNGGDSKPVDVPSMSKSVEACLTRLSNADAHRFVAQELHEIHQMIQFRALRLRRQEEETSAAAARATNALRQYAQQLLNQAADKLARLATQQQKRTEATAEKAADILRRATEARCALRHERSMMEQLRRRQGVEQELKLRTVSEALDAERRRCVDLEARVEVLQQENRQLRAALRAPLLQSRGSRPHRSPATKHMLVKQTALIRKVAQTVNSCKIERIPVPPSQMRYLITWVAVSTSSSSAASEPVAGRRRSHSTRCAIPTPQYQRISFSVPQPGMQHPMEAGNDSSCSSVPRRSRTGGHKLALRQDVAGRLQASLMRLQGRQGKMQHIAKQLLDPQEL